MRAAAQCRKRKHHFNREADIMDEKTILNTLEAERVRDAEVASLMARRKLEEYHAATRPRKTFADIAQTSGGF